MTRPLNEWLSRQWRMHTLIAELDATRAEGLEALRRGEYAALSEAARRLRAITTALRAEQQWWKQRGEGL